MSAKAPTLLLSLLRPIMAPLAKALKRPTPELRRIAPMRLDVVADRRGCDPAHLPTHAAKRLSQGLTLDRQKTGAQTYIPLSDWMRTLLAETPRGAVQIVVSEETSRPYTYRNFAKWVALIRDAAELPDTLKAGNLRHEAGQEAEEGGADPGAIQGLLAHKSVGTQRYYVKRARANDAQAARQRYRERGENKT